MSCKVRIFLKKSISQSPWSLTTLRESVSSIITPLTGNALPHKFGNLQFLSEQIWLVSTYVVCERLSVMNKQVSVHIPQTVNFCPNSPESPFLEFQTRKPPPPPQWKTSDLRWPKFTPEYPPSMKTFRFEMTKVYSGIPPQWKLQIWDDQSLLWNNPPPKWKTSDLRWPKFTLE